MSEQGVCRTGRLYERRQSARSREEGEASGHVVRSERKLSRIGLKEMRGKKGLKAKGVTYKTYWSQHLTSGTTCRFMQEPSGSMNDRTGSSSHAGGYTRPSLFVSQGSEGSSHTEWHARSDADCPDSASKDAIRADSTAV